MGDAADNSGGSEVSSDGRSHIDPKQARFDFAHYVSLRYPLYPKVTVGEGRLLFHNHILDIGSLALDIAMGQTRTARFGTATPNGLLARVVLPNHRFDKAAEPPQMPAFWLDTPVILIDLKRHDPKRFAPDLLVSNKGPELCGYMQLLAYSIDLANAVVVDGYHRLRQAARMSPSGASPSRINYISITAREAIRYIPTMNRKAGQRQSIGQLRSLFINDQGHIPSKSLHRYIPAAIRDSFKGPGVGPELEHGDKFVIGKITVPVEVGRPRHDELLEAILLQWQLEFRRARVFRDLLEREWKRGGATDIGDEAEALIRMSPGDLYDAMTEPLMVILRAAGLVGTRFEEKRPPKPGVGSGRDQYLEKIGVMGLDAFLDKITGKTYTNAGFESDQEFISVLSDMYENINIKSGLSGGVQLLNQSIRTAIILFKIYFRIKCFIYPLTKEILSMKQKEKSFKNEDSKASEFYKKEFYDRMNGVIGEITNVHIRHIFEISARIGYNLCEFYPNYNSLSDIVDVLVEVIAQHKDKKGEASKSRRAYSSTFTFASYILSEYEEQPDRREQWADLVKFAELHGVKFDEIVAIYARIYKAIMPEGFTKHGIEINS